MVGHGHANYVQMTCKPTQDLPDVAGAVEGAEESEARSPGGWWGHPGPYPTMQTDPAQPQGSRFGVEMGVPEHQRWFCCWLRKSRTWPRDSGKEAGTHRAARQSKAHAEREGGGLPWSHTRQRQRGPEPRPSESEARVPQRPKLQTIKYTDKEIESKQTSPDPWTEDSAPAGLGGPSEPDSRSGSSSILGLDAEWTVQKLQEEAGRATGSLTNAGQDQLLFIIHQEAGKNTVERVSGARRWSMRMRWKALLQADCWCLLQEASSRQNSYSVKEALSSIF